MNLNRTVRIGLLLALFALALACRTTQLIAQSRPTATRARPPATKTQARPTRTKVVVEAQVVPPTSAAQPAEPTDRPQPPKPRATNAPAPTKRPVAQPTTRPANTPVPPPTVPQFPYQVTESRCGPNVRTYIEGYVYENNTPKNEVLVRISQGPDGQPDPNDDFRTGSDPRKGYFFQNIDANAPHEGTWYLWVIDPANQQRISAIAIVKTDAKRVEDSENSSGSCQSATLRFSNTAPVQRTAVPTRTTNPNGPTPEPTQDEGDDS